MSRESPADISIIAEITDYVKKKVRYLLMAIGVVSALRSEQSNGIEFWLAVLTCAGIYARGRKIFGIGLRPIVFTCLSSRKAMLVMAAHLEWL
jgi:hypothetical protein